jgi:hypothetical protein
MHPKVRFLVSVQKDLRTFGYFANEKGYEKERGLEWAFFKKYPELRLFFKKGELIASQKEVRSYVGKRYRQRRHCAKRLSISARQWKKAEEPYFALVRELFPNTKWPAGKYIAYGTIWGMYPRFLADKTFQIPFKHRLPDYINVVIAHELLHFIFFSWFERVYGRRYKTNEMLAWHTSEVFNSIIQNSTRWLKVFKVASMTYPEHDAIIKKLAVKYYKRDDWTAADLTKDIIAEVKKRKLASK